MRTSETDYFVTGRLGKAALGERTIEAMAKVPRHVPAFTVNVSGQTLEDEEFPLYVAREAMAAGVPARLLRPPAPLSTPHQPS